jgi:hypothetical protein
MTLLEINEIFNGKFKTDEESVKPISVMKMEDWQAFRELLALNETYTDGLRMTENSKEFYEAYPIFDECIPNSVKEDVFYASKLGFFYEGYPCKLVYILREALKRYENVNVAISAIDYRGIQKFIKKGALGEDKTIATIIYSLLGKKVKLISKSRRMVENKPGEFEVYIPNVDRVALLPEDIASRIDNLSDLKSLQYEKNVGIHINGQYLRTFNGRIGITLDDFDLREAK